MSQLILNRGNTYSSRPWIKKICQFLELGPYFLVGSLVMFVVLITVITLLFSTRQVTKGYVLNRLDAEHQQLIKDSERSEMQISEVRSLDYIQKSSKVKKMRRPAEIVFFVGGETAIASR